MTTIDLRRRKLREYDDVSAQRKRIVYDVRPGTERVPLPNLRVTSSTPSVTTRQDPPSLVGYARGCVTVVSWQCRLRALLTRCVNFGLSIDIHAMQCDECQHLPATTSND